MTRVLIRWMLADSGSLDTRSRSRSSSPNSPTAAKVARNWRTASRGLGNNDGQVISQINLKEFKNQSALSDVAYTNLGAILLSLVAPNPSPKVCYWQRTSGSRPALY